MLKFLKKLENLIWIPLLWLGQGMALAEGTGTNPDITKGLDTAVNEATLANKIVSISTKVGALIGAVAVGAFILGAFQVATAANEEARAQGKQKMMWALAGVAAVGLAVVIVSFWANTIKGQAGAAQ
ncbi:pilin [Carboxydothermus ferrireducens]|uniref:TrbC/VIRB2 family protein n=1 Tax=Carboxydothermus ferrireducens DSM 11255 TaxID=1119529 RepID=A0ABX2RAH4_9THEO|nr:pilin [Carboxydothermus ferrireducens]NYE57131.1 hypothetical protein [Carboxydothermus ferrireducens DSM 11255]